MFRFGKKILQTIGNPPGTPVFTGEGAGPASITVTNYDANGSDTRDNLPLEAALQAINRANTTWIDIRNLRETDTVTRICNHFGFHPIIEESFSNSMQRTRMEEFDRYLYFVLRDCRFDQQTARFETIAVNCILADGLVITTTDSDAEIFPSLYKRLATGKGRIRTSGPDYLLYTVMDTIVDRYFLALDGISEYLDRLEAELLSDPVPDSARRINNLKSELFSLRRMITPLRDIIISLRQEETEFFTPETRVFVRDLYEHTILIIESLDMYRERLSGLFDNYLSSISNRMNRVMQLLTLISTIFIPLTFLAGVYGMNFKHMPELGEAWAYPALWGIFGLITVGMVVLFKRKRWF